MVEEKKVSYFGERLEEQIKILNKSYNQVERELGYPRNALHNYKHTKKPSGDRLMELSNYFGVSPEYLIGGSKKQELGSVKVIFHNLSSEQRREMLVLCQDWLLSRI